MALRKRRQGDVIAATKNMSDAELRKELQKLGFSAGPITDSTRALYKKKLDKLKAESAKNRGRTRKSEGNTRLRRSEPLEDEEEWEEEERADVSPRASHRNSYGGSGRVERADDGRGATSSHVGGTGPWRNDRSSQTGSHLIRGGSDCSASLGYEHRPSLGAERTSDRIGNSELDSRYSVGGDRYSRDSLGLGARSSLQGDRYSRDSLGLEDRSSLGGESYARSSFYFGGYQGQEPRSLGSERFPKTTSDYGSLEEVTRSSLGGERFTRNSDYRGYLGQEDRYSLGDRLSKPTSDYGSLGQRDRSSLGGERFTHDTSDYSGYRGQELRSRLTGERSSWSGLPVKRDEGRPWSGYNEQGVKDQLYYKNDSVLNRGKLGQCKPNWSINLEYYLSKLVQVLSVGLFIIFLGILIMKSGMFFSTQQNDIKLIPADCEGKDDRFCKAMQKQTILEILSELYKFLSLEAGSFECGNPSGLSSKCIPVKRAKELVMNVCEHPPERFDAALEWLLDRNEHLGIWAKDEEGNVVTTSSLVFCVESSRPLLGITCRLINALYTAISNLFLALFGVFVLWLFLIYLRYHWRKVEEEEQQMFIMVEKIIDVVKHHYKDYQQRIEQNPYIGILHVRDTLIMPQDRKHLKRVWDRAVQFIEDNESRLRTESQRVAGADLRVWRWTQTRHEIASESSSPTLRSTY